MSETLDARTDGLPIVYAPRGFAAADTQNPRQRAPKAAEVTASRIVDDLLKGSVRVGDKLPTEPEMVERYEVKHRRGSCWGGGGSYVWLWRVAVYIKRKKAKNATDTC